MVKTKSKSGGGKVIIISDTRRRGTTYNFRKKCKLHIRYNSGSGSDSDSAGQPETNTNSDTSTFSPKIKPIRVNRTRKLVLTPKRKIMIRDFRHISSQDQDTDEFYGKFGQDIWLQNLHKYMEERDNSVSLDDVKRWFKAHEWIRVKPQPQIKNVNPAQNPQPRTEKVSQPGPKKVAEMIHNPDPDPNPNEIVPERPSGSSTNKKPLTSTPKRSLSMSNNNSFPSEFDAESAVSKLKMSSHFYNTFENSEKSQNFQDENDPASTATGTSGSFSETSYSLPNGKFKNVRAHTPDIEPSIYENSFGNTPGPASARHGIRMRKVLGDLSNNSGSDIGMSHVEPDSTNDSDPTSSRETESDFDLFISSIHDALKHHSKNHKTQNDTQNSSSGSILIVSHSGEESSSTATDLSLAQSNTATNASDQEQILSSLINIVNVLMRSKRSQNQNQNMNTNFEIIEIKLREIFGNIREDLISGRDMELNLPEIYAFLGL